MAKKLNQTQVLLILSMLCDDLDEDIVVTKFSWNNTDGVFHIHFFDSGGNKHHKSFNQLGHVIDWED